MVENPASPGSGSSSGRGTLYRRFIGPLLDQDEGTDAEQLSQVSLAALGQAALRQIGRAHV